MELQQITSWALQKKLDLTKSKGEETVLAKNK